MLKTTFELYLEKFENLSVLVIGDLMLDEWNYSEAIRLSPEAPIPVSKLQKVETTLGGAGNVCVNISKLGAHCHFLSVIGHDIYTDNILNKYFKEIRITTNLLIDSSRKNTIKKRFIVDNQHILRMDREDTFSIGKDLEEHLCALFKYILPDYDAVIIEDYNKGLLTPFVINFIVQESKKQDKKVFVDPKVKNIDNYRDSYLFKPNKKEFENIISASFETIADVVNIQKQIYDWKNFMHIRNVLLTLGKNGMVLFRDSELFFTDTNFLKGNVIDVTGAGDIVIALYTLLEILETPTPDEKLLLSSLAAQTAITQRGTSTVDTELMFKFLD